MKKFHPILFSTLMVQGILEGRKIMTRRILKPQPAEGTDVSFMPNAPLDWYEEWFPYKWDTEEGETISKPCPYGKVGDVLWVRETWQKVNGNEYLFKANSLGDNLKWKPSIFMPKSACRIFLQITGVRVERLHDIDEEDIYSEGISNKKFPFKEWERLWQKINGAKSWEANPFVWVIEFKQIAKPENFTTVA